MSRISREPLLHFLLLGAALFGLFALVSPDGEVRETENTIVVSAGRIEQLSTIFQKTWQRPPTEQELKGLVDDFVLEEIYYRQAIEMGIDRDDTVIRRRLRQKVEFLTDDAASLIEPSDEDLREYLATNQDKFREDSTYTFRQLYINPEKHGEDPRGYMEAQLNALRAGETVNGDSGLIPKGFDAEPGRVVDGIFGRGFAAKLDSLEMGVWQGPVESGLGVHLVMLDGREPGAVPDLEAIRPVVEREWANERRLEMRNEVNAKLREAYEIVIEWPEEEQAK